MTYTKKEALTFCYELEKLEGFQEVNNSNNWHNRLMIVELWRSKDNINYIKISYEAKEFYIR